MNDDQMPIAEATDWPAEKWADAWSKEAYTHQGDFLKYKADKKILNDKIDEMRAAITTAIELLEGLDEQLNGNRGLMLLTAIDALAPFKK